MFRPALWIAACLLVLTGCASSPQLPPNAQLPWRDQAFGYDAALVTFGKEDLFRLDPELERQLQDPAIQGLRAHRRLDYLLTLLYGPKRQRFQYAIGHSTAAAETWKLKRGDCLSLTVLTYAAARALNISAQMQEVDVAVAYDRRGSLDVVNRHVNVRFAGAHWDPADAPAQLHDVTVDFEPEFASRDVGRPLTEDAILARYYNNLAVEYLGGHRPTLAYAYFKAAITLDPTQAASYINMAVLYHDASMVTDEEAWLRRALALSDPAEVALPMRSLHQLLVDQGRAAEAQQYASLLKSVRERDPYYWIDLGVRYLQGGDYRRAIDSLEHALAISNGFTEAHRYLALAYWRSGNLSGAKEQLALLESLNSGDPGATALRKKFKTIPQ
jgi:Tfp pilus assembly protein PilF